MVRLPSREVSRAEVELVHTAGHCEAVDQLAELEPVRRPHSPHCKYALPSDEMALIASVSVPICETIA